MKRGKESEEGKRMDTKKGGKEEMREEGRRMDRKEGGKEEGMKKCETKD